MEKSRRSNLIKPRRGWRRIYKSALRELKTLGLPEDFKITGVQEQNGVCMVEYKNAGPREKEVQGVLATLTKQSASTCQDCGRKGRLCNINGCSLTLCHRCFNKWYGDVHAAPSEAVYLAEKMKSWFRSYH
ncbi:MAG: hypothetical protein ACLT3H_15015 [Roseburia sp.]